MAKPKMRRRRRHVFPVSRWYLMGLWWRKWRGWVIGAIIVIVAGTATGLVIARINGPDGQPMVAPQATPTALAGAPITPSSPAIAATPKQISELRRELSAELGNVGFTPVTTSFFGAASGTNYQGIVVAFGKPEAAPGRSQGSSYLHNQVAATCIGAGWQYVPFYVATRFKGANVSELSYPMMALSSRPAENIRIASFVEGIRGNTTACGSARLPWGYPTTTSVDPGMFKIDIAGAVRPDATFALRGAIAIETGALPPLFLQLDGAYQSYGINPNWSATGGDLVGVSTDGKLYLPFTHGDNPCKTLSNTLQCVAR